MTIRIFSELVGMAGTTDPTAASPASAAPTGEAASDGMTADSAIVRRVLAGDVEAFGTLVNRHHGRCLTVATGIVGNADDAEDAVQEAFVRAYRALGSYQEREKFAAWLLRIVVNCCRTHATRQRRWAPLPAAEGQTETLLEESGKPASDLIDAIDASARREELALAMSHLHPDQREAVTLRFGQELTYDEMAALTGVGVSALKMRVQRACARLRELLSEHLHA